MRLSQFYVLGLAALMAISSVASHVRADDDQDAEVKKRTKKVSFLTVVASPDSKQWIGVYAVPVEAALKSHLGIKEDRVIVKHVMDDSPAKKAGVQVHDVLLQFGDVSIGTVEDLIKAVAKVDGEEADLTLIRGGKKTSLKLTAEERPNKDVAIQLKSRGTADASGVIVDWLQKHNINSQDGDPYRIRVIGPGVVDRRINLDGLHKELVGAKAKLPKNLSIQINKKGEAPAKVKVTRDGETWDVTEESLDELPEDIRAHVKRSLGGHSGVVFGFAPNGQQIQLKTLQVRPGIQLTPAVKPQAIQPGKAPSAGSARRILRKSTDSADDVEQLRKDLEDLKAVVEKLQAAKPQKVDESDDS